VDAVAEAADGRVVPGGGETVGAEGVVLGAEAVALGGVDGEPEAALGEERIPGEAPERLQGALAELPEPAGRLLPELGARVVVGECGASERESGVPAAGATGDGARIVDAHVQAGPGEGEGA
jgi:hypothetical protein